MAEFRIRVLDKRGETLVNYMEAISASTTVEEFKRKFVIDAGKVSTSQILILCREST